MAAAAPVLVQLGAEDGARQRQGDGVGDHQGPVPLAPAVEQPQQHPEGQGAVGAGRNAVHLACAQGQPGLWHESQGGEGGGRVAEPVQ